LDLWAKKNNLNLSQTILEAKKYLGMPEIKFQPVGNSQKYSRPEIKNKFQKIEENKIVLNYLTEERKLNLETLEKFKIRANEKNEIVFPFFKNNELINLKYLTVERPGGKKQIHVEKNCEPILFGWQALDKNARKIILTEGEMDCMTLHQFGFDALSIPFGAGKGNKQKWLEIEFDELSVFDEIYLCMDNDEHGEFTISELITRLGQHRCRVMKLPYKDANECLQKNISREEIFKCFENSFSIDPKELKQFSFFVNDVIEEFYPTKEKTLTLAAPFEKAKNKILFRAGELSLWVGINGHGKSQFIGQIILNTMMQGARVCVASLELRPERLLARLTRQASGLSQPTSDYIRAIHEWYHDKAWIFDLVGTAKTQRLLEVFIYARQRYGINVFVIDSLMKCGMAEDDYNTQKLFVEQLCDFKNEYNCHVHLVVHPRKSDDESSVPGKLDIKGTGAISDLADNCFSIWRNKKKEDEIQKVESVGGKASLELESKIDCLWTCDKQRNGDWEGKIGLWFDKNSYQYLNCFNEKPKHYVQFSQKVN
jgi:twinkle protein